MNLFFPVPVLGKLKQGLKWSTEHIIERRSSFLLYIAGWGCAQGGWALCCQGSCAKSCSTCLCSGSQLALRATLTASMSSISPFMATLLLITAFHGCVIHISMLLQQPAIRAPPVPFSIAYVREGEEVPPCTGVQLSLPTPASSHLLPLHIPILVCSEHSQPGKLLHFTSHGMYLQISTVYLRSGVFGTRGCRPCSLTACSCPQRMPLRKQLRCWTREVFQVLVHAVLPVQALSAFLRAHCLWIEVDISF